MVNMVFTTMIVKFHIRLWNKVFKSKYPSIIESLNLIEIRNLKESMMKYQHGKYM
jgi:hypothetical protein